MALLEVSHLGVGFRGADGEKDNTAVDDVSFALEAGEVLGMTKRQIFFKVTLLPMVKASR